jgi:hypothetical protein
MATGVETLISPEMLESKGVWCEARTSPPIALSDIRKWAIATYWPETPPPIHWDEAHARASRFGGIIAPRDFNPFAWPIQREPPAGARVEPKPGAPRLTSMNGGQTDTFGVPMRPGDTITGRSRLADLNERQGRFGLMLYRFSEIEWTNQKGEFVRRRISTSISY